MPVAYSARSLPLSANAANTAFSNGVDLAWDFTGIGATASGEPWLWVGATKPTLPITGTQTLTTINAEPGVVAGASSLFDYTNTTNYGWQTGAGDFTIGVRVNLPGVVPANELSTILFRLSGTSGNSLSVTCNTNSGIGWYFTASGSAAAPIGGVQSAVMYPAGASVMVWVVKSAGVVTIYTQNATAQTNAVVRYAAGAAATQDLGATWAARTIVNWTSGAATTFGVSSIKHWNLALSSTEVSAIGKDYWDTESNGVVAQSVAITSPVADASILQTSIISGTYTGADPAGIQVQHGAGAWITGSAATIGGGVWSATFSLTVAAAASLQARMSDATAVVSTPITGVSIISGAIGFTAPYPATSAQDYRQFQRNGENQASVRVTGTYSGSPTSLQWSWNGSAWATLVASPTGGVFDATITLTGPAQSDLQVRFSNDTTKVSTLASIGVCDVYLVAGQSNHVGGGNGDYIAPVAPAGNPSWVGVIYAKNGTWRPNVETAELQFSKTTGAIYPVQAGSATAFNSYFGKLATKFMAEGSPVAFVPCALGSTSISSWAVSTSTSTLYGAMIAVANTIGDHKAVLWWQGEADCSGTTNTAYQAALNALVNDWYSRFSRKWVLMNLNATGNSVGTGGTAGTDTGFNAIHAAIATVGATNANVFSVADMNGAFSSSIHYRFASEITEVSNRAYAAMTTVFVTPSFSITLTTNGTVPAASLTGINWAWYDAAPPSLATAPVITGTASTDASGVLTGLLVGSTLTVGQVGTLLAVVSDGTPGSAANKAFCAPVAVS